ncbi:MAG: CerR family C-terminal domain-containing protein [Verrucomicrobia bacterium]|nr:CerR family C-terminal domain-containing protein [Verrucomicrobiota bacterium]MBV8485215.1 CerR family C-terminal domain-containing protein [Verrucomicrobiota bacterium]
MSESLPIASDLGARARLLDAAADIFGTYNLEGATTRQLAERAGVNQAAIPYYFGGKEGLYVATIEHFFSVHAPKIGSVVGAIESRLTVKNIDRGEALDLLKTLLGTMLEVLLRQQTNRSFGRIIIREQMQPTKAFDLIYERVIRHVHQTISALLAILLDRKPDDRSVIFRAQMLVGQILVFLAGRETIRRRLNLTAYTDEEFAEIKAALHEQLDLLQPVGLASPFAKASDFAKASSDKSEDKSEARSTKRGGRK